MFVLGLQKIRVFWLVWLMIDIKIEFVYFIVYLRIFFVVIRLLLISDLWLLLVYSSIGNTGMIVLRRYGSRYFVLMVIYMRIILVIIRIIKLRSSYREIVVVVFFFLVIPPFVLFWMKFFIVMSLEFVIKVRFFFLIFDVLVLLYYFSLIFIKFILLDLGYLIYVINVFVLWLVVRLRNYVALIVFYKS
jgi:hypothetical protein